MSRLHRAEQCPTSEVLPHVDEESDEYGRHGRAVHDWLDAIAKGVSPLEALTTVDDEHHEAVLALDLTQLPHGQVGMWDSEVAVALNVANDTARLLGVKSRRYGTLSEHELPGTADLVGLDPDGETLMVLDVKTGRYWHGRPGDHLQLLSYARALALIYGRSRVRVGWLYVRRAKEPKEQEPPLLVVDELDFFQLEAAGARIRDVVGTVEWMRATNTVKPFVGRHCTYCPAFRTCPAHTQMLVAFQRNDMDVAKAALGYTIEKSSIPLAFERVKAMRDLLDRVEHELEEAVRAVGKIPTRNGKVLANVMESRETLVANVARGIIDRTFGPGAAAAVIETKETITKKAVMELVSKRVAVTKEPKGAFAEAVFNEIRAAGGTKKSSYPVVREVDPKRE
jgi:hypothetical protein